MGEVYRARDARLERDVAIKVVPEQFAQDAHALARYHREVRAVAALSHPNIVTIYDIGTEQGVTYAVMELLEGHTLRSRIKLGRIDWPQAVDIAPVVVVGPFLSGPDLRPRTRLAGVRPGARLRWSAVG
jgi:serine/threonine protein kinase